MKPTSQPPTSAEPSKPVSNTAPDNSRDDLGSDQPSVNRKKQKRRQKEAAKRAVEQLTNAGSESVSTETPLQNGSELYLPYGQRNVNNRVHGRDTSSLGGPPSLLQQDSQELYYTDDEAPYLDELPAVPNGKSKKKRKNKAQADSQQSYAAAYSNHTLSGGVHPPPPPPPPPLDSRNHHHRVNRDRIWNTSTAEERENIKEFWLGLEEPERRSLVKIEKEAVLKKMKEQQKQSCSCQMCGRKRNAIEEELEVLYDAYYEELEQYANHEHPVVDEAALPSPPGAYPQPRQAPPRHVPPLMSSQRNARSRFLELPEDEELEDDETYSDEEESQDEFSDEEFEEEPPGHALDFFNFGNSLTVRGGILTVADDLLQNDGRKFIEMMEQLAERRMQREGYPHNYGFGYGPQYGHSHGPPMEEDEYDDEEDDFEDDVDGDDTQDYGEDEMDLMSDAQRMEEGRRMFQIFAARMFEQRVLTAYREKVARERQERLLEELENEDQLVAQREAKKTKEAAKKKEKKKQQKQVKDEERAKKEAEKAAVEEAVRAEEEQKAEEQRQKREEQRRKRDAERKQQEEERTRKENDKLRKLHEAREQQAETERKQREQKEKDKKKREDAKKKEQDERAAKEHEAKERKEKEVADAKERDAKAKADRDAKDKTRKEEQAAKQAAHSTPAAHAPQPLLRKQSSAVAIPNPSSLQASTNPSPHLQIATPVIPKAPSPARQRQTSNQGSTHGSSVQGSQHSSPKSSQVLSNSSATSPSTSHPVVNTSAPPQLAKSLPHFQPNQKQASISHHAQVGPPPGMHHYPHQQNPGMMSNGFSGHFGPAPPGMHPRIPPGHDPNAFGNYAFNSHQYRGFSTPNGVPYPPGMNGIRPMASGPPGFAPMHATAPQPPIGSVNTNFQPSMGQRTAAHQSHSRHASASLDKSSPDLSTHTSAQPIGPPAPISRPSPTSSPVRGEKADIDELSNQLGSSALLDDTDLPLSSSDQRSTNGAPGSRPQRSAFAPSPIFPDSVRSNGPKSASWMTPSISFASPGPPSASGPWSAGPSSGWSTNNNTFGGPLNAPGRHLARPVMLRLLVCQACRQLNGNNSMTKGSNNDYHSIETIARQVNVQKPQNDELIHPGELLEICDTEGNAQNGGGLLSVQNNARGQVFVKYEPDQGHSGVGRGAGAPGDIGSPVVGSAMPFGSMRGFPGSGMPTSSMPGF